MAVATGGFSGPRNDREMIMNYFHFHPVIHFVGTRTSSDSADVNCGTTLPQPKASTAVSTQSTCIGDR